MARTKRRRQGDGGGEGAEAGKGKEARQGAAAPKDGQRVKIDKSTATHPRKKMYRARAHSNPLNETIFSVPVNPDQVDWSTMYPDHCKDGQPPPPVRFADIGCGFGGLLVRLSPLYPDTMMVGMELRDKVTEYVKERIVMLRRENPGKYTNIACVRNNGMKFMPNYFRKAQLTKMFFLFPDPHFKAANHRRRIINTQLLTEYAYVLAPGGWLYTITDVPELGEWMKSKLHAHPLFERVSEEELAADHAANLLVNATEEGQKVERNSGPTFRNVYRRLAAPREGASLA